jgi:ABC-2 type transport system ATP-binding protein
VLRQAQHERLQTGLAVEAVDLVKDFAETRAVDGVSLEVPAGSIYGLLGPNGAGKTTAVRILTTLLRPDGGSARVEGLDVVKDAAALRERIGLAGQYAAVDESLTGRENLELFGRLYGMSKRDSRQRANELLVRFELGDAGHRLVGTYSGGMRRRLDLAGALVARPPVLFLDEPTTGLDPRSRLGLWQTIEDRVSQGATVLLTTQYLDEADRLADQIAVIDHGKVIAEGTAAELKDRVGGDRLEVTLEDQSQAEAASRALATVVDGEPELRDGVLLAAVSRRDGTVANALRRLDEAGIQVGDLVLRRPSLDDVFLSLTGHEAVHEEEAA